MQQWMQSIAERRLASGSNQNGSNQKPNVTIRSGTFLFSHPSLP